MTTANRPPTRSQLEGWVSEALERSRIDPEELADVWAWELLKAAAGPIERWTCQDDDCPARPAWDRALSDLLETVAPAIAGEMVELGTRRLTLALAAHLAANPDTPLGPPSEPTPAQEAPAA